MGTHALPISQLSNPKGAWFRIAMCITVKGWIPINSGIANKHICGMPHLHSTMCWRFGIWKSIHLQPMVSSEFASSRPFPWFQLPDTAGLFLVTRGTQPLFEWKKSLTSLDRTKSTETETQTDQRSYGEFTEKLEDHVLGGSSNFVSRL